LHLLALGVGLGAVGFRAWACFRLSEGPAEDWLPRVLGADNLWGLAALLWIGTGLARAFGGLEKGSDYYLASDMFRVKMALFALTFLLEAWPMVALIQARRGRPLQHARLFGWISVVEAVIVVVMVFVAGRMARGG
jgi:putative membrane protein